MKTKLLRKIRKRFNYYFREFDGRPVLIDLKTKNITIFNDETLCDHAFVKNEEQLMKRLDVSKDEYAWRRMKSSMYAPFGYSYSDAMFNRAKRIAERSFKKIL